MTAASPELPEENQFFTPDLVMPNDLAPLVRLERSERRSAMDNMRQEFNRLTALSEHPDGSVESYHRTWVNDITRSVLFVQEPDPNQRGLFTRIIVNDESNSLNGGRNLAIYDYRLSNMCKVFDFRYTKRERGVDLTSWPELPMAGPVLYRHHDGVRARSGEYYERPAFKHENPNLTLLSAVELRMATLDLTAILTGLDAGTHDPSIRLIRPNASS